MISSRFSAPNRCTSEHQVDSTPRSWGTGALVEIRRSVEPCCSRTPGAVPRCSRARDELGSAAAGFRVSCAVLLLTSCRAVPRCSRARDELGSAAAGFRVSCAVLLLTSCRAVPRCSRARGELGSAAAGFLMLCRAAAGPLGAELNCSRTPGAVPRCSGPSRGRAELQPDSWWAVLLS